MPLPSALCKPPRAPGPSCELAAYPARSTCLSEGSHLAERQLSCFRLRLNVVYVLLPSHHHPGRVSMRLNSGCFSGVVLAPCPQVELRAPGVSPRCGRPEGRGHGEALQPPSAPRPLPGSCPPPGGLPRAERAGPLRLQSQPRPSREGLLGCRGQEGLQPWGRRAFRKGRQAQRDRVPSEGRRVPWGL